MLGCGNVDYTGRMVRPQTFAAVWLSQTNATAQQESKHGNAPTVAGAENPRGKQRTVVE
jgi:hypothetical protein